MSAALDIFTKRALGEEGSRRFAYNDRTGKTVTCKTADPATTGNLSIGEGINLEVGLDDDEIVWLFRNRAGKVEAQLLPFDWYVGCNDPRKSVLLDIAFNGGVHGLLHYPKMLGAIAHGEWLNAKAECQVSDDRLKARYAALGDILLRGEA